MHSPPNVFINNLALGDAERDTVIYSFGAGSGYTSLSRQGGDDAEAVQCKMITLDSYLSHSCPLTPVNFVKVDIEGAELMFLKGAEKLFGQSVPPLMLIEMAAKLTSGFGYLPDDLIKFISARADYEFFAVNESDGKLGKIEGFDTNDIGANVFCLPRLHYQDRVASVRHRII